MSLIRLEQQLLVWTEPVNVATYDFDFELYFQCDHPAWLEREQCCIMRVGSLPDYDQRYQSMLELGVRLVNSPAEHLRASELPAWYAVLDDLTPRSMVFESLPHESEVLKHFDWPIFIKGTRQTSKHDPELSIIHNATQYAALKQRWLQDDILHWQAPVIREFVPLQPVSGEIVPSKVLPSVEFRSFWWNGVCVGFGQYWYQVAPYLMEDWKLGLAVAQEAAARLKVPFLVIDIAKTAAGKWIVIECNDAQESGYTRIAPLQLWQNILLQSRTCNERFGLP